MRLLLRMNDQNTLNYISNFKKDEYTAHYFQGFPKTPNGGISYWNEDLAAQAAGFALNENSSS